MLYFGIDVSRDKLDCAVVDEHGLRVKRARTFANDAQGIIEPKTGSQPVGWSAGVGETALIDGAMRWQM